MIKFPIYTKLFRIVDNYIVLDYDRYTILSWDLMVMMENIGVFSADVAVKVFNINILKYISNINRIK